MIGEMGNKSLRELNKLRGRTSRARRFSPKLSGALHDSATHRSQRVYWPLRDGRQQRVETLLGYTAKIERDFTAEAAAGFHHMRFRIKLLRGLPD